MLDTRLTKDWIDGHLPDASFVIPQYDQLGFLTELRATLTDTDFQQREVVNAGIRTRLHELGVPQLGVALRSEGIFTDLIKRDEDLQFDSFVEALMNAVEHGTDNLSLSAVRVEIHRSTQPPIIIIEHEGKGFPFERIGRQSFGTVDIHEKFPEFKDNRGTEETSRGRGLQYLFNHYCAESSKSTMYDLSGRPFTISGCLFRINFERLDDNQKFRTILEYSHTPV
jgi:hypothetical protein